MPEPRTCHLPKSTALVCIGINHLCADLVVTDLTELEVGDE